MWKADYNATGGFVESFYKNLKRGKSREETLLNTQSDFRLGLIESPNSIKSDWSKPFYWGAFILTGDWKAIKI